MRLYPPVLSLLIPALIAIAMRADPVVSRDINVSAISQNGALIVTVTDEDGAGVADAAIAVRLSETAAAKVFADGAHAVVGYSDQHGEARFPVLASAAEAVDLKIVATKGDARAGMLFELKQPASAPKAAPQAEIAQPGQTRRAAKAPGEIAPVPPEPGVPTVSITHGPTGAHFGGGGHKKWIVIAAVAGAGAGAVFLLAAKKSSNSSAASSSGLSIGTPTVSVGAP